MNPAIVTKNFSSYQGDGVLFPDLIVTDAQTGAPIDLTGSNVYVTVKRSLNDQASAAIAKFKTGDATTYFTVTVTAAAGHIVIQAHAAATASLSIGTTYPLQYDVKVDTGNGTDPETVMHGVWTVNPSVTTS